jgi:uncharacterized membrane protein YfcA
MNKSFIRLTNPLFILVFLAFWAILLTTSQHSFIELVNYSLFTFLGTLGAIFANATGAGGGVVFIPMFTKLNFSEQQSIATSFAIQCFGMTAGAVTWWHHYQTEKTQLRLWQGFKRIIVVTSLTSVLALNLVFFADLSAPAALPVSLAGSHCCWEFSFY